MRVKLNIGMPTINLPPKKEKNNSHNDTENRVLRKQLYQSTKWQKCRAAHLVHQPICQECLKQGKVNGGTKDSPLQVHHIRSPFINGKINWDLALDDSNLETICAECHGKLHQHENGTSPEELLAALEDLFNSIEDED
jgi:5-methylcytosine-specific restriction protein A